MNFIAQRYQVQSADDLNSRLDYQDMVLNHLVDLAEADETYDKASGKARKLLRGTTTVLLEKDVMGSTCTDSVSIAE